MIKIVVAGASGRMGQTLIRMIAQDVRFQLHAALEAQGHSDLGKDAAELAGAGSLGVALSSDALEALKDAQAVVDFTVPAVSVNLADIAAQARIVHVIGTTGFSVDAETKIRAAARHAVIVKSGNMSMGVTLLAELTKQAARALPDFDIEIVEMHHRMKVDAPSGTALLLGTAAAQGRGVELSDKAVRGRDGNTGARKSGDIGFVSLRGGSVVGEHEIILAGEQERITLGHIAEDRSIFARGALNAAAWGQDKKPGLYAMADVLGFSDSK